MAKQEIVLVANSYGSLHPATEKDQAVLQAVFKNCRTGRKTVTCTVRAHRNEARHRFYWSLLGRIAEHSTYTTDALHHFFLLATGNSTDLITPSGTIKKPKSIAFSNMSESDFQEYVIKVRKILLETIYPQLDEATINYIEGTEYYTERYAQYA